MKSKQYKGFSLHIIRGDISQFRGDAIVNAANHWAINGAGVAGAIDAQAGPELQTELDKIGYIPVGHSVVTPGYGCTAKWILNAVAPVWEQRRKLHCQAIMHQLLADVVTQADNLSCTSLAIPAIGTGVFSWPMSIFLDVFQDVMVGCEGTTTHTRDIYLILFTPQDYYFTLGYIDPQADAELEPICPEKPSVRRPTGGIRFTSGTSLKGMLGEDQD